MFYVYLIENEHHAHYTGCTSDLRKRLREHNQDRNRSTKGHIWRCIYYEACLNEEDAYRREAYLKTTQGRRMLKRRLKEYLYKERSS